MRIVYVLISLIFFFSGFTACSDSDSFTSVYPEKEGIYLMDSNGGILNQGNTKELDFRVLIYKVEKSLNVPSDQFESYQLDSYTEWMEYDLIKNEYTVNFSKENLEKYNYKLIVLGSSKLHELDFNELYVGKTLDLLSVASTGVPLTKRNYFGYLDVNKEDVLANNGVLILPFNRVVGELLFDFGRYSDASTPIALDDGFNSTLDRVFRIDVGVLNYTRSITTVGEVETAAPQDTLWFSYDLSDYLLDEDQDFKVDLSKAVEPNSEGLAGRLQVRPANGTESQDLTVSLMPDGTTRFFGPYLMRTEVLNSPLKVFLRLYYYDTYMAQYPDDPLPVGMLQLDMPQPGKQMNVVGNSFTLSTIKLMQNRVIDEFYNLGDVEVNPDWSTRVGSWIDMHVGVSELN